MSNETLDDTRGDQWLRDLKNPRPDRKYFALTLGANRRGKPFWGRHTHFVGWSERNPRWEMREASLVDADQLVWLWKEINQSWFVVHDVLAYGFFFRWGGNALVEKDFAEDHIPDVISPSECMRDGGVEVAVTGFLGTGHISDDAIERRVPSRKLRMQVLKRDNYRCVICGRRTKDHVDLELHVHHLIPWRMHGPTAEENLVTLCGACHKGLDPDYQPMLRELAGLPGPATSLMQGTAEFDEEVARYRAWVAQEISKYESRVGHGASDAVADEQS
ncbi:HNH endonuclease signature motif containing protein [Mycobacterium sp. NPDC050853]|uniref:HNH endonuclease n=1 Tax=Mycobacterium sp. NPDC050853 TaxID=3155160 RepID=UPI00340B0FC4